MKRMVENKLLLGIIGGLLLVLVLAFVQMQEWLMIICSVATLILFVYLSFFRDKKFMTNKQIVASLFIICLAFMVASLISTKTLMIAINRNYDAFEVADKNAKEFERKYKAMEKETADWRKLSETEKALQITEAEARKKEADEKTKAEKEEVDREKAEQERVRKEEEARNKVYRTGTYKVGVDMPAGEYKISQGAGTAFYWQISTDANGSDIVENEFSQGEGYFSCSDGQYVKIQGEAKLV